MNDWNSIADGTGWRVLEMIHIATLGMILWVDTFEAMALLGIVIVIFYSVVTEEQFMVERSNNIVSVREAASTTDIISSDVLNTEEYFGSEHGSQSSSPTPPPSNAFTATGLSISNTNPPVKPTFTKWFANFCLIIGVLALLDFLADVLRFVNWHIFGKMAMATNILLGVIFLPIWLLILASQLPDATDRFERGVGRVWKNSSLDGTGSIVSNGKEIS